MKCWNPGHSVIQFPANVPGKAAKADLNTGALVTHLKGQHGVLVVSFSLAPVWLLNAFRQLTHTKKKKDKKNFLAQ